jgi:hypothetical protein
LSSNRTFGILIDAMNVPDEAMLSERSAERRRRMTVHIAADWHDADDWDLEYWQRQGPEARLSALVALRNDLDAVCGANATLEWDD